MIGAICEKIVGSCARMCVQEPVRKNCGRIAETSERTGESSTVTGVTSVAIAERSATTGVTSDPIAPRCGT